MLSKKINFSKEVKFDFFGKDQILIYQKDHLLIDKIAHELVVSLMSLNQVDYQEFVFVYSEKYKHIPGVREKIETLIVTLIKHQIVFLS